MGNETLLNKKVLIPNLTVHMNLPQSKQSGYLSNISFVYVVILLLCNSKSNSTQALTRKKERDSEKKDYDSDFLIIHRALLPQTSLQHKCDVSQSFSFILRQPAVQLPTDRPLGPASHCTVSKSCKLWLHHAHEENRDGQSSPLSRECAHTVWKYWHITHCGSLLKSLPSAIFSLVPALNNGAWGSQQSHTEY